MLMLMLAAAVTDKTCCTGVLGAYAYWGPKAGAKVFTLNPEGADLKFGAVTVATGVVGTILGGVTLDRVGSTMRNALIICCISNVLGGVPPTYYLHRETSSSQLMMCSMMTCFSS